MNKALTSYRKTPKVKLSDETVRSLKKMARTGQYERRYKNGIAAKHSRPWEKYSLRGKPSSLKEQTEEGRENIRRAYFGKSTKELVAEWLRNFGQPGQPGQGPPAR